MIDLVYVSDLTTCFPYLLFLFAGKLYIVKYIYN